MEEEGGKDKRAEPGAEPGPGPPSDSEKFAKGMDVAARRKLYEFVLLSPGCHMREIQRRLEIPLGTLEYHLKYLVEREYLSVREEGGYKRYYPVGTIRGMDKGILSLLRQDVPRRIVMYLLLHPGSKFGELAARFDIAPSTLSFHLAKLLRAGIVSRTRAGRESTYRVENEHEVARVLIAHRRSFLDALVDSFVGTWTQLHP
ncbi:MAG: winged helix-turn-helix transcriptional regulator [Thermoplasmatota archaeon]